MGDNKNEGAGSPKNHVRTMESIPMNRVPNNIKMPEQLTTEELQQEVARLRSILKQADAKIQDLSNGWGLKRLEFLMKIMELGGFGHEDEIKAVILEDLGVIHNESELSE